MSLRTKFGATLFTIAVVLGFVAIADKPSAPPPRPQPAAVVQPLTESQEIEQYRTYFLDIVDRKDPYKALQELARRMKTDRVVFKECHALAHEIGHRAYKKYQDFNKALEYQDSVCSDGYLHGVIEYRFARATDLLKEMGTVCGKYADDTARCYHGVGHGLMFATSNDLPRALKMCDTYDSASPRTRCYEGVFMENFLSNDALHPSRYRDEKDPFSPCPVLASDYKTVCYFYAPIYFLELHEDDYAAALDWCDTAETGFKSACAKGVGSLAMKYHADDPNFVQQVCSNAKKGQSEFCIDGMVSYFLTFHDRIKDANDLCGSMEKQYVPMCEKAVKNGPNPFRD